MALNLDVTEREEGVYVVRLDGRLDTDTSFSFEEKIKSLFAENIKALIFDMSKLEYISSSGLGVLFYAKRTLEEKNSAFVLINLQPQIEKVLELIKALPKMPIFRNIEEVDRYLNLIQQREIDKRKEL